MPEAAENSKSLTVAEAAGRIASLSTWPEVLAFVEGDERKGVVEAANRRGDDLAAPSPDDEAGGARLASEPGPEARPGVPFSEGGSGKVTVRTRYPVDRFEHGVDGAPTITAQGVEVDRSKAAALLEAAATAGTELEEVG